MLVKLPYCFYGITARGGGEPTRTLILLVISCFSLQILTRSQKSGGGGGENSIIIQYSKCKFMKKFSSRKSGEGAAPSLLRSYIPCTLSLTTKIHYLLLIFFYNKNFLKKITTCILLGLYKKTKHYNFLSNSCTWCIYVYLNISNSLKDIILLFFLMMSWKNVLDFKKIGITLCSIIRTHQLN